MFAKIFDVVRASAEYRRPCQTIPARHGRRVSTRGKTMHAIPTKYKGIQFRSRLEATWAAFFDLCGWQWEYEPCDFAGWIPDFILWPLTNPTYVEVKPVFRSADIIVEKAWLAADRLMLLGTAPHKIPRNDGLFVGWDFHEADDPPWDPVLLLPTPSPPKLRALFPAAGDVAMCVPHFGWWIIQSQLSEVQKEEWRKIRKSAEDLGAALWAEAKNAAQWRAPLV